MEDVPSSNRAACAKALEKEGMPYMLRADGSSMWLENSKGRNEMWEIKPMITSGPDREWPVGPVTRK